MASTTIITLLTFSLLTVPTTQISPTTIKNAAEILSNSGFTSISLTLSLISTTLISTLPSSTLFAPPDESFSLSLPSGQPSLSLLKSHFCPRFYTFLDLQSLSYGSHIGSLNPNFSITVTSSSFDDGVFVNGVRVKSSPVFDDGDFVVFAIDRFFNPNFSIETGTGTETDAGFPNCGGGFNGSALFLEASNVLRSRGYSLMAGFLDLQLIQFRGGNDENTLTIFAPRDVAMEGYIGNFSDLGFVFLRYVVGCELNWVDLIRLNDGFILNTFLKGFRIHITRNISLSDGSDFSLMLNGQVYVDLPELYRNERIVVHGLSGVLVDTTPTTTTTTTTTLEKSFDHQSAAYPTASNAWKKGVQHVDEF